MGESQVDISGGHHGSGSGSGHHGTCHGSGSGSGDHESGSGSAPTIELVGGAGPHEGNTVIKVETQRMPKLFVGNLGPLVATSQPGPTLAKSQRTLEGTTFSAMVPRTTSGYARMRQRSIAPGTKAWG